MTAPRPLRVGLTGGIGSGKSTVAQLLVALGAGLVDADAVAQSVTAAGGQALKPIEAQFGPRFVHATQGLNRTAMREHVFAHPEARTQLEAIIHPIVAEAMAEKLRSLTQAVIVLDIPLLVESPRWRPQLDVVCVVDCSPQTQIQRVRQRNGWDDQIIHGILRAQAQRLDRLAAADWVIANDTCTLDELSHGVTIGARWLGL